MNKCKMLLMLLLVCLNSTSQALNGFSLDDIIDQVSSGQYITSLNQREVMEELYGGSNDSRTQQQKFDSLKQRFDSESFEADGGSIYTDNREWHNTWAHVVVWRDFARHESGRTIFDRLVREVPCALFVERDHADRKRPIDDAPAGPTRERVCQAMRQHADQCANASVGRGRIDVSIPSSCPSESQPSTPLNQRKVIEALYGGSNSFHTQQQKLDSLKQHFDSVSFEDDGGSIYTDDQEWHNTWAHLFAWRHFARYDSGRVMFDSLVAKVPCALFVARDYTDSKRPIDVTVDGATRDRICMAMRQYADQCASASVDRGRIDVSIPSRCPLESQSGGQSESQSSTSTCNCLSEINALRDDLYAKFEDLVVKVDRISVAPTVESEESDDDSESEGPGDDIGW